MKQRFLFPILLFAILSPTSQMMGWAQLVSFDIPQPVVISDGAPSQLTFTSALLPAVASIDLINVQLSHEWLGDLTVTIIPPAGPEFILFDRVGVTPGNPDGSGVILGTFGENLNPNDPSMTLAVQTYHFARTGADFGAAAQNAIDTQDLPVLSASPTYAAQTWPAGPFQPGAWQLIITDNAELSGGQIASGQLLETPVPEPGASALAFAILLVIGTMVRNVRS